MKLPRTKYLRRKAMETMFRFPLTLGLTFLAAIVGICLVETDWENQETMRLLGRILMTALLGLPLSIAAFVYAERLLLNRKLKWVIGIAIILLMTSYFFTLPEMLNGKDYFRSFSYFIAIHLIVSFAPFIGFIQSNGFWQFNKMLFLRFLLTALYAIVLYAGLSLALLAVDQLFKADIDGKVYMHLWIIITGPFGVWFFLTGLPTFYDKLQGMDDYPKGLRVFSQYVLFILIGVYAAILYAYFVKVVLTSDWPIGWVVYLVLAYSVLGIFACLLVYPLALDTREKTMGKIVKAFFISLLPLLVMLFIAIFKRVNDYGFTENRLIVIILGIWIAGISIYLLITRMRNLKMVPVSLAIIMLLAVTGPWSVFSISSSSQVSRLKTILDQNKCIQNDFIIPNAGKELNDKDQAEISTIMSYLIDWHGADELQPLYSFSIDSMVKADSLLGNYDLIYKLMDYSGMEYMPYYDTTMTSGDVRYYQKYTIDNNEVFYTSGYDFICNYDVYFYAYEKFPVDTFTSVFYTIKDLDTSIALMPDSDIVEIRMFPANKKIILLKNDSICFSLGLDSIIAHFEKGYFDKPSYGSVNIKSEYTRFDYGDYGFDFSLIQLERSAEVPEYLNSVRMKVLMKNLPE
jgi:hypothetical protein